MSMKQVLVGFVPWIVFTLVATRIGPGAVGVACALAFLAVRRVRDLPRGAGALDGVRAAAADSPA
jgi:hypothetical protein